LRSRGKYGDTRLSNIGNKSKMELAELAVELGLKFKVLDGSKKTVTNIENRLVTRDELEAAIREFLRTQRDVNEKRMSGDVDSDDWQNVVENRCASADGFGGRL
jgi:cell fate (sporulation/competence/biofilm development) regulator YlbF (YheA/YmcA/DUF963 family)